ncbi:MAG: VWA domain-containing protein [Chloroflexi bacterium]|nr:VWA domain-containing protein [Chloroflexota bacterium]
MSNELDTLQAQWSAQWQTALATWSKFTKLGAPHWCATHKEATVEGLSQSFAMIRLTDQTVVIDLQGVRENKLDAFAREVLAHEIGHHVYAPADLTDHARMLARMRWALPTKENLAPFVANLYTDLLINDRLQRSAGLHIADVYQQIGNRSADRMWTFYMRIYEILWSQQKGTLTFGEIDARLEGDAQLGARLIRSYARDWLDGSGRFAALCLPYLLDDDGKTIQQILKGWRDMQNAGAGGGMPSGLTGIEDGEKEGAIHPSLDPDLAGEGIDSADADGDGQAPPVESGTQKASTGQARQPFEFGEILRSLGIDLDNHEIAARYYKERAVPHLIRFPSRIVPESTEPLPEGTEPWEVGQPLEDADWTESILRSPRVIPGLTTVRRVWGSTEGKLPESQPLDLDLYVDCSGSMPDPQVNVSYLTLAGAIIALSALRAGARVQATLWSGKMQYETTKGFIRDEHRILQILTGYFGDGTQFPLHILRDTFADRKPSDRPAHILIISDNGVTTMFDKDEQGADGWAIARMALAKARGGGTMVLNLFPSWEQVEKQLVQARDEGWDINPISSWEELVEFARKFSRKTYAPEGGEESPSQRLRR